MSLERGTSFGHYTIEGLIGKGGMGEVYHAKDEKLGRQVAIKVLPAELAEDSERLARFKREAKVLALIKASERRGHLRTTAHKDCTCPSPKLICASPSRASRESIQRFCRCFKTVAFTLAVSPSSRRFLRRRIAMTSWVGRCVRPRRRSRNWLPRWRPNRMLFLNRFPFTTLRLRVFAMQLDLV